MGELVNGFAPTLEPDSYDEVLIKEPSGGLKCDLTRHAGYKDVECYHRAPDGRSMIRSMEGDADEGNPTDLSLGPIESSSRQYCSFTIDERPLGTLPQEVVSDLGLEYQDCCIQGPDNRPQNGPQRHIHVNNGQQNDYPLTRPWSQLLIFELGTVNWHSGSDIDG